jgi:hypothetical protein
VAAAFRVQRVYLISHHRLSDRWITPSSSTGGVCVSARRRDLCRCTGSILRGHLFFVNYAWQGASVLVRPASFWQWHQHVDASTPPHCRSRAGEALNRAPRQQRREVGGRGTSGRGKGQKRRAPDLRGKMSENHICIDCGLNTAPGNPTREEAEKEYAERGECQFRYNAESEVFIVHNHVWAATGIEPYGGCLCVGCLEKRIGRELIPDDFPSDHPFMSLPGTERLLRRQGRYDPLGNYELVTS